MKISDIIFIGIHLVLIWFMLYHFDTRIDNIENKIIGIEIIKGDN